MRGARPAARGFLGFAVVAAPAALAVRSDISVLEGHVNSSLLDRFDLCDASSLRAFRSPDETASQCRSCVGGPLGLCKWCPLSQECIHTGWGYGGPCKVRNNDDPRDEKLKGKRAKDLCSAHEPNWLAWMRDAYGEAWDTTFSVHHGFAIKSEQELSARPARLTLEEAQSRCSQDPTCRGFSAFREGRSDEATPTDVVFYGFHNSSMRLYPPLHGNRAIVSYLSGKVNYLDAMRCFQWALDWPIEKIEGLDKDGDEVTQDSLGTWACTSVLLRHGTLGIMGRLPGQMGQRLARQAEDDTTAVESNEFSTKWKPNECEVMKVKLGSDANCKIRGYLIDEFAALRRVALGGAEDITSEFETSVRSGPLLSFKPGAGLSGSTFASTWDYKFKVKLGLKTSNVDEPQNLMDLVKGTDDKETLLEHLQSNPGSLLNRYYGLLKVDLGGSSGRHQWCVWMHDASYTLDFRVGALGVKSPPKCEGGACLTRYDLKGKSRDQMRKQKPDKMFTLENGDFRAIEYGYLKLGDEQCLKFRASVESDAKFLDSYEIIDYSFFLVVVDKPSEFNVTCEGVSEPFCFESDSRDKLYTASTIDYLNDYTLAKKMESLYHKLTLKGWKFKDYGGKMVRFAERICRTKEELANHLPLRDAILKKYARGHADGANGAALLDAALRRAFDDKKDANNRINFTTFKALLKELNLLDTKFETEWKTMFIEADADNSGELHFEDFAYMLT